MFAGVVIALMISLMFNGYCIGVFQAYESHMRVREQDRDDERDGVH
ncbi:hypothetical protein QP246_02295 [Aerococcus urinae]|nr:hypothetical protein [Aerococcus urinae]MDK6688289.1 hypothetical protein [Aerococcus urinae]